MRILSLKHDVCEQPRVGVLVFVSQVVGRNAVVRVGLCAYKTDALGLRLWKRIGHLR
ncbi:hypothetical protein DP23_4388 [Ralstonia pickettii]|nr:hypothetical protein DP23_4388 [Ralstonia pickettii]